MNWSARALSKDIQILKIATLCRLNKASQNSVTSKQALTASGYALGKKLI